MSKAGLQQTVCNVLVAGGGSAGLAAAVSAARAGARTVLVERNGFLGGMGTAALVHTICGLYHLRQDDEPLTEANPGFATEFVRLLKKAGGASDPVRMGRVDVVRHDPWAFALLADRFAADGENLEVFAHAELGAAKKIGDRWHVELISRGKSFAIDARAVVDATGDAAFTALADAAWVMEGQGKLQRPAYIVKLAGVKAGAVDEAGRLRLAHGIAHAVKAGQLPVETLGVGFRAGLHAGECYITMDLDGGRQDYDPLSASHLGILERTGRATAQLLHSWLVADAEGFSQAWVAMWPTRAGVRESRRMNGAYVLSGEDILQGRSFEDAIATIGWPLELREKASGPKWRFPETGVLPASIPLRALRHADHPNLFAAGRCLSADHEALASVRVMGTCMATGEAAGIAAAYLDERKTLQAVHALRSGQVSPPG